jgi:hypothetical protein
MEFKKNYLFENGKWWYVGTKDGYKRSLDGHTKKNKTRMFVAGKYIPKTHPMHRPGIYKSFEDAWTHQELDQQELGYVYVITNPAWPDWVKIGMAVDANDRLKAYQTSSPHRDYQLESYIHTNTKRKTENLAHRLCERVCEERSGEWFKMPVYKAVAVIQGLDESLLPVED